MATRDVRLRRAIDRTSYDYVVNSLSDPDQIRDLLVPRIEYTAYALGQLEPGLFERARWSHARGDTGTALVVHSRGGLGDASFAMGDPDAVAAILSIHPGPAHTYSTCEPSHVHSLERIFRLSNQLPMVRMVVTKETFKPHDAGIPTVTLGGFDIRKVNGLYSSEGGTSYYIPEHLDGGLYRGVMVQGRLASVAGTHVVSRQEGVAVVGNVFTHPQNRGHGYATAATSAVTGELLEFCETVVLTVDPRNHPAVSSYRRLGYKECCRLVEASAHRRDPTGIGAALRRTRAKFRGRRYGGPFVSLRPQ